MQIKSILVIPFADGIGDFINVQPLLTVIQKRYPGAELTVAVSEHGRYLVNDPAVRTVKPSAFNHEVGKATINMRWLVPQTAIAWVAGPLFERELGPFDLVINLFYAWERTMDFRGTWTPQVPPVPDVVHSLDCLADELERELEVEIPLHERTPHLTLRVAATEWADDFWQEHDLPDGPVIGLVPSTNMVIKRWPLGSWIQLDRRLHERLPNARMLLFCDKPVQDSRDARQFAAAGSATLPVYTSLDRVAALLARCDLVIGVDTGLLHMAGALDVPWLGLFGPTNPAVTGPYNRNGGIGLVARFAKPDSCAPCWKRAFKYEDDRCLTLEDTCTSYLPAGTVVDSALSLLANRAGVATTPNYRPPVLGSLLASPLDTRAGAGFLQHT